MTHQVRQLPTERLRRTEEMSQVMVSAHSTMIEGSQVTQDEAFAFLTFPAVQLALGKGLASYDMLGDHARALTLALAMARQQQFPTVTLVQQLAAAVMASTGISTVTVLGTVDPAQGDFRQGGVFIVGASSFPNAQKVPVLVAGLSRELSHRMPLAEAESTQLMLAFEAHQRLVCIHPFNDGNGRTSRILMNYIQHVFGLPLTIVFREDKEAYFEALEASRQQDDLEPFYAFMRRQHGRSLRYQLAQSI